MEEKVVSDYLREVDRLEMLKKMIDLFLTTREEKVRAKVAWRFEQYAPPGLYRGYWDLDSREQSIRHVIGVEYVPEAEGYGVIQVIYTEESGGDQYYMPLVEFVSPVKWELPSGNFAGRRMTRILVHAA